MTWNPFRWAIALAALVTAALLLGCSHEIEIPTLALAAHPALVRVEQRTTEVTPALTAGNLHNPGSESRPSDELIIEVPTLGREKIPSELAWKAPVDSRGAPQTSNECLPVTILPDDHPTGTLEVGYWSRSPPPWIHEEGEINSRGDAQPLKRQVRCPLFSSQIKSVGQSRSSAHAEKQRDPSWSMQKKPPGQSLSLWHFGLHHPAAEHLPPVQHESA